MKDDDEEFIGGLTDEFIARKHKRLRGSSALRYPPNESRCRLTCGLLDCRSPKGEGAPDVEHRCFLGVGHQEACEFSSECVVRTVKARG